MQQVVHNLATGQTLVPGERALANVQAQSAEVVTPSQQHEIDTYYAHTPVALGAGALLLAVVGGTILLRR